MNNWKRILAGFGVMSVILASGASLAQANVVAGGIGATDPISQWIVLDGLFSGTNVVSTSNGTAVSSNGINDPISEWIVLDGLFGGNNVVSANGTTAVTNGGFNDPISEWIVLDSLFGGPNVVASY